MLENGSHDSLNSKNGSRSKNSLRAYVLSLILQVSSIYFDFIFKSLLWGGCTCHCVSQTEEAQRLTSLWIPVPRASSGCSRDSKVVLDPVLRGNAVSLQNMRAENRKQSRQNDPSTEEPTQDSWSRTWSTFHVKKKIARKKKESEVAQSCLTLCDPMDCSPPGSSLHGILQARVPEWAAKENKKPTKEKLYGTCAELVLQKMSAFLENRFSQSEMNKIKVK